MLYSPEVHMIMYMPFVDSEYDTFMYVQNYKQ